MGNCLQKHVSGPHRDAQLIGEPTAPERDDASYMGVNRLDRKTLEEIITPLNMANRKAIVHNRPSDKEEAVFV